MMHFHRFVMVAVLSTNFLVGCGTQYVGTTQTPAASVDRAVFEELQSAGAVGLRPLSFAGVKFRTGSDMLSEEQAFAGKGDEKRASWEDDKAAMVELFRTSVGTTVGSIGVVPMKPDQAPGDVKYVVESVATVVDPGYFATAIFNAEAYIKVHCRVIRVADGAAVFEWDEIETSAWGISSGERMRHLATAVGLDVFRVIRSFQKAELASR
ncbi:MAG: hypothetical protein HOV80_32170 [Polyangiaceae bacterium]|nr:hypothetical protein [Polyangiaceae bacterium]